MNAGWTVFAFVFLGFLLGWLAHGMWTDKAHKYRLGDEVRAAGAHAEIIGIGRPHVYTIDYGPDGSNQPGVPRICEVHEMDLRSVHK